MVGTRLRWSLLAAAATATTLVRGACECGYQDPLTGALWTDATISYFNETGLDDVVTLPTKSPRIYGEQSAGDTGTGQQPWSVVGDHVNEYEESFGATWRSAVSYNNTFLNESHGLAMQISPADTKHRIVNGSQLVSRRRDIQYGSFRAMILPAANVGAGGAFTFGASYNESETVDLSIFLSNDPYNGTLRWSYSASGHNADPVKTNLSYVADVTEQRFDWLSSKVIQFRNDGTNASSSFLAYEKKINSTNIPTSPAPISFQTYANGEPSKSQGPPLYSPLITTLVYTRMFFNSTLSARHVQFEQQCAQTTAPVCSTDDLTLRNSTAFFQESLLAIKPAKTHFRPPLYAVVCFCAFLGIFLAVMVHGIIVRRANKTAAGEGHGPAVTTTTTTSSETDSWYEGQEKDRNPEKIRMGDPFVRTELTSTVGHGWDGDEPLDDDDSEYEYDSDNYEDLDMLSGDIERRKTLVEVLDQQLPTFTPSPKVSKSTSSGSFGREVMERIASPIEMLDRMKAHRQTSTYMRSLPSGESLHSGLYASSSNGHGSMVFSHNGGVASASSTGHGGQGLDAPFQPRRQIIRWKDRRDDEGDMQLARPSAADQDAIRRPSVVGVQQTLLQVTLSKWKQFLFIDSEGGMRTSTGERRIDYLDGMRGFACLFVSLGHFTLIYYYSVSDPTGPSHYPKMTLWLRMILGPIIVNAGLVLGIFFTLPARTMCMRYLLKGGVQSLADSTVRRIPRLALPVLGACIANYFLIDVDAYKWVPRLASRTWSVWSYWQNYDNVMTFVNAFITLWWAAPPDNPALVTGYATGVLWTIPVIIQGMWTCMLAVLIAHELKRPWKRFTYYAFCVALSWYANTWDLFFMSGLIVADLDANLKYRDHAKKGITIIPGLLRIELGMLAWVFFLGCAVQQWLTYIPTSPGYLFDLWEYGIHPDWVDAKPHDWNGQVTFAYTNPRVGSWLWVMSTLILVDLSPAVQTFFRLRLWSWLGKHSMAFYLCHGIIFWTWGAWLCLTLLEHNVPYWAAILLVFTTSYTLLTALCICFTYTFEWWSILFSKAVWRASSGGLGRKV